MKFLQYLLIAVVIVMLGGLGGAASFYYASTHASGTPVIQMVNKEDKYYIQENTALVQIIESVKNSIAGLENNGKAAGSGLALTSDGLVATLAGNVPSGSTPVISINGDNNVTYQVLKRDVKNNLALIKVNKSSLATEGFYDLSQLKIGTRVFVLSQVYSGSAFAYSVNEGIVKSFTDASIKTSIIDSGAVNGSPVFDISGNVLGLAYKEAGNSISIIPASAIKAFAGI
jgi:hypothetical protein